MFQESQTMSGRALLALLVFLTALQLLQLVYTSISVQEIARTAALALVVVVGLALLFRLKTSVGDGAVYARFPLGLGRRVMLSDILAAEVVSYRPLRDFGGWGYRIRPGRTMLNVRGTRAVRLDLADGGALYIGSQRPEELLHAVQTAR